MITQYYEGSTDSKWIEVANRSSAAIPEGKYYLALYDQGVIAFIQHGGTIPFWRNSGIHARAGCIVQ